MTLSSLKKTIRLNSPIKYPEPVLTQNFEILEQDVVPSLSELEQQLSSNSNPSTASRRNPSPTDRIPFVPASFATSLAYNDYNTMPSLVPDMERRSQPTFQLPAKSKRCVCSLFLLAGITMYQ
ncbi:hypothetical protein TNCV_246351 [Trichonephila clavipes]|nr:hypothetical protein TNCV_246351 [Trichonephila clavipes]